MLIVVIILSVVVVVDLGIIIAESVENDKFKTENQELKAENQKLQTESDKLKTENESLKTTIANGNERISKLNTELEQEHKSSEKAKAELRNLKIVAGAFDDINQKVVNAKTELEQTKAEQAEAEATLHQTERKLEDAEEKLHDVEAAIEEKERSLHELETRLMSRSQLERSDKDTDKLQSEIEALQAQIDTCTKTADLSGKIARTMSSYRHNTYRDELLCGADPSHLECVFVGLRHDGNIAFAYPVVSFVDLDNFKKECERYDYNNNYKAFFEAYGIFLQGDNGESQQQRLMEDISSHHDLEKVIVLTDDVTAMSANNQTITWTFERRSVKIECGYRITIIQHKEGRSTETTGKTWSDICGWIKKNETEKIIGKLKTQLDTKQYELEQAIATDSQLFMADTLLNLADSQQN